MMNFKILGPLVLGFCVSLPSLASDLPSVRLGVIGGYGEEIAEIVSENAEKYGLKVVPVVFDGIVSPNTALHEGDIQANLFQHQPYLDGENKNRGYDIVAVGPVFDAPLAFYSTRYKSLNELPEGASIAVPEDAPNQSRALFALQDNSLLRIKPDVVQASVVDVADNPRKFKFVELGWAVLPLALKDVDAGGVNAVHPFRLLDLTTRDAIGLEAQSRTKQYTVNVAVNARDRDAPWVKPLLQAVQSAEVKAFLNQKYRDVLVPAF